MSKQKKLFNSNKKDKIKSLDYEYIMLQLDEEFKDKNDWCKDSSFNKDLPQYKIMSKSVEEFKPKNSMYFTFDELVDISGKSKDEFMKECWKWYISLEEDDWDPCKELCGLCEIMKDKFNKYWYPKEKYWK